MIAAGISETKLAICGHPNWEQIKFSPPQHSHRTILVVDQVFSLEKGILKLGFDDERFVESVEKSIVTSFGVNAETVFAQHPRRTLLPSNLPKEWRIEYFENIKFSSFGLVIGAFSSVMIESYLQGIPTVSIQPDMLDDNLSILSRRGLIMTSRDLIDLNQVPEIDVIERASFADCFKIVLTGCLSLSPKVKRSRCLQKFEVPALLIQCHRYGLFEFFIRKLKKG